METYHICWCLYFTVKVDREKQLIFKEEELEVIACLNLKKFLDHLKNLISYLILSNILILSLGY